VKDAIGGSLLLNLVVIFTSIIILFFAGILAYSKAYKVKNKIIEIIEAHDGQIMSSVNTSLIDTTVLSEINTELKKVGYLVSGAPDSTKCSKDSSRGNCTNLNTSEFNYCICNYGENSTSGAVNFGTSYEVITYVHFSFPVIGDLLTFPVRGETRVLGKDYNY
jgi:hypothetical protein